MGGSRGYNEVYTCEKLCARSSGMLSICVVIGLAARAAAATAAAARAAAARGAAARVAAESAPAAGAVAAEAAEVGKAGAAVAAPGSQAGHPPMSERSLGQNHNRLRSWP